MRRLSYEELRPGMKVLIKSKSPCVKNDVYHLYVDEQEKIIGFVCDLGFHAIFKNDYMAIFLLEEEGENDDTVYI